MFYSQLQRQTSQIETVRCGLSCFSIHFHIPKRNIKSSSTYLTPMSSPPFGRNNERQTLSTKMKKCIEYLWITRISVQFNSIPCLIILFMICFLAIFLIIERSNGYYYYHKYSSLPFLYPSDHDNEYHPPTMYELQDKIIANYPNVHVIAGPPLSRSDLGHITWLYLHTMGVNYGEEPTEQRKNDLINFWESFSRLYPCGECAKHMRDKLKKNPPNVDNNREYSKWLCELHNDVNNDLKIPNVMDCNDIDNIFKTWEPKFCGCDNEFIEGVDNIDDNNNDKSNENTIQTDKQIVQKNSNSDLANKGKNKKPLIPRMVGHH